MPIFLFKNGLINYLNLIMSSGIWKKIIKNTFNHDKVQAHIECFKLYLVSATGIFISVEEAYCTNIMFKDS